MSRPGFDSQIQDLHQEQINIKFDNVGANWRALNQHTDEVEILREMMKEREELLEALANAPEGAEQEEETFAEHYGDEDQAEEVGDSESDGHGDKTSKGRVTIDHAHRPHTQGGVTYDYFMGHEEGDSALGILERGVPCEFHTQGALDYQDKDVRSVSQLRKYLTGNNMPFRLDPKAESRGEILVKDDGANTRLSPHRAADRQAR